MTQLEIKKSFTIIISLSFFSLVIWLIEMTKIDKSSNEIWLQVNLLSPFLICLVAAACYLTPFLIKHQAIDIKVILTFLTLTFVNLSTYLLAETFFLDFFSQNNLFFLQKILLLVFALVILVGFASAYYFITQKLILELSKKFLAYFLASAVLMFVFSLIIGVFFRDNNTSNTLSTVVKMGYPQFWICLLLGLIGIQVVKSEAEN